MKKITKRVVALVLAVLIAVSGIMACPMNSRAYFYSETMTEREYYTEYAKEIKLNNLLIEIPAAGFNPSEGNYIKIKTAIPEEFFYLDAIYSISIKSPGGNVVYRKVFNGADVGQYISFMWDGKGTKNTKAPYNKPKYVAPGQYTVEMAAAIVLSDNSKIQIADKKQTSFVVSKNAPAGKAGVNAATKIPIYAVDDFSNYVIAMMCVKAGVNRNMSEDEKVKKIYQWEVRNFKHAHNFAENKVLWDEKALAKEIQAFAIRTDKEVAEGKAIKVVYDVWPGPLSTQSGVCDDNAAAFKDMLLQVAVDAGICSGYYLNRNGTASGHSWNNASVNGVMKYYDVDVEIQNVGKTDGWYWFNKTRAQSNENHEYHYEEIFR